LAVAAFGLLLVKLNVLFDAIGGGSPPHPAAENAGAFATVAARYAGLALVVIGIAVMGRSSAGFERTRRAINRDEVIQMPQSRSEIATFRGTRDRCGNFLHLSRCALTFSAHNSGPYPDRRPPWI
jgi:hypothetical protein